MLSNLITKRIGRFGARYISTGEDRIPVIVSFARTPIGKFGGALSTIKSTRLAAVAIQGAISRAGISASLIEEAFLGNVVSAGIGQAPARQAVISAGLPKSVICTTVNKVCASGLKTVMLAAQAIQCGSQSCILAGGFESMSQIPYYLPKARTGHRLGHASALDGVIHDGLWDPYGDVHMGNLAEACATKYNISRNDQDMYALQSYDRATAAQFADEIVPVVLDKIHVTDDEEMASLDKKKFTTLRPAFKPDGGSVTAGNSSKLSDGASACIIMSLARAKELKVTPLARILGFADAELDPSDFPVSPSFAVPKALKLAGLAPNSIDLHEINEAFAVVALANISLLKLDVDKVNVNGGAIALGHPIGMSGNRLIGSVISSLKQRDKSVGCVSICNGGGGASALILERMG